MSDSLGTRALIEVARSISLSGDTISVSGAIGWPEWATKSGTLGQRLTETIYSVCYAGWAPAPTEKTIEDLDDLIVDELSWALERSPLIDWSWELERINSDGSAAATQRGWRSTFTSGTYLLREPEQSNAPTKIGVQESNCIFDTETQNVMVRYRLFGTPTTSREVRIYLNVKLEHIVSVLTAVTGELLGWEIPYALKVPGRLSLMQRRDKIVLYLDERDFEVATGLLGRVQRATPDAFIDEAPLFTCPLLPGVSFAESPSSRQSFGMERAAICSRALMKMIAERSGSFDERLKALQAEFVGCGISLERPFLSPNSAFRYDLSLMKALSK